MKILTVLSSHDKLGATGKKTGFCLDDFARTDRLPGAREANSLTKIVSRVER